MFKDKYVYIHVYDNNNNTIKIKLINDFNNHDIPITLNDSSKLVISFEKNSRLGCYYLQFKYPDCTLIYLLPIKLMLDVYYTNFPYENGIDYGMLKCDDDVPKLNISYLLPFDDEKLLFKFKHI